MHPPLSARIFILIAGVWLAILVLIYLQGITGTMFFDDTRPLNRLSDIEHLFSRQSIDFVFGDISGPLGRPVAMLTFLAHYKGWPDNLKTILLFNIIIHFFNGLLLYFVLYKILALIRQQSPSGTPYNVHIVPVVAVLIWLSFPIHTATVFVPIQRMAILSTSFVLVGILAYLAGLQMQARGHQRGPDVQLFAIVVFLPLAILSKENGALLPLFLLVIEVTLLRKCHSIKKYRSVRLAILSLATMAVIVYLGKRLLVNPFLPLHGRDFSVVERLLTQPFILLDYLTHVFWPRWQSINPFQDHWRHVESFNFFSTSGLATVFVISWIIIAFLAIRRWPWFSFASLWFFGAHLLESSTIGLELYFLHRNYLPFVGVAIFLAIIMVRFWSARGVFLKALIGSYILFLVFSLGNVAALWGHPERAAQVWFDHEPASSRSAEFLAGQMWEQGDRFAALEVIEQHLVACSDCVNTRSWALALACAAGDNKSVQRHAELLLYYAPQRAYLEMVGQNILVYQNMIEEGYCKPALTNSPLVLVQQLIETRPSNDRRGATFRLWFALLYLEKRNTIDNKNLIVPMK